MDHEVLERILDGRENPTNLSLSLLKDITENFSEDREIGHGGFATVYKIIDDTVGWVLCMDAHQTEPLIITGHESGYVQIWNSDTQKVVASIKVSQDIVSKVKFIARKRWIVAASRDCFVHVYKYEKELETVTSFKVHDGDFVWCSLDVHPTQPYVLSGCFGQIKLWDWDQDWNCIQTFEKEHSDDIRELKFNPEDTNSFASASDDYTVKVWSLDSPKSKYTLFGHSHHVYCLDFFKRDGQQYLISGSRDDTAKIWDLQKKECVHTLEHEYEVVCYVFAHPSLPVLITGGRDGAVRVWSSTDFRLKKKLEVGAPVYGLACLMGSERVAVAHFDGVSVMEIGDEEGQGGCEGSSNENSIAAIDS
uniref:Uncharacterized protein n=2 Tax=Aegilops tauschii subsp. strangulata TaxID=200361 RepID=A0A453T9S1_AEGTS|nr:coatomer subunit beta'-2 isoform X1 [Aegilops tauschii subsp. strangulata]XP_045087076.1 coatomer subunit beta'-2 isoform X1 [Aegilops tauschii subsp. strangulata]